MRIELIDESMTRKLGKALAKSCPEAPFLVTLTGNLGAGKSHLARAFLKKLGVTDAIPSPTYTLCETYLIRKQLTVSHMDVHLMWHDEGRLCALSAKSEKGEQWLDKLKVPKAE